MINASGFHRVGKRQVGPHARPGIGSRVLLNLGPVSPQETRALIFLSILRMLLFSWSVQVAFLQLDHTELHIFM